MCLRFCRQIIIIILTIIIMSFINSMAFRKIRKTCCRHVIQCWQRFAFRLCVKPSSTVLRDTGQLADCSISPGQKQHSSCDQWLWLSNTHPVCQRQPTSDTSQAQNRTTCVQTDWNSKQTTNNQQQQKYKFTAENEKNERVYAIFVHFLGK